MSTDSEIIRRSLDEPGAFSQIFERHVRAIGGYIRRRVGQDAVEDVLSETFLVAFRRRGSFDHVWESARPWLLGIATRLVRSHRAMEARQWRAFQASAGAGEAGGLPHDEADEHLDAQAALRELAPRIAALSVKDRDTLLLYAWGDLTYEQVAAALGVPVGTVRSRLNRGPPQARTSRIAFRDPADMDGDGGELRWTLSTWFERRRLSPPSRNPMSPPRGTG